MSTKNHDRFSYSMERFISIFPLFLVFLSLTITQLIPLYGDRVSERFNLEICSTLRSITIAINSDEPTQQATSSCLFCSVTEHSFLPPHNKTMRIKSIDLGILYRLPLIEDSPLAREQYTQSQPRAPPYFS